MRIVSGLFRSRPIIAPDSGEVRPTSDKVRQAVFNVLEHAAWAPALDGAIVLDVFCGTGALGIEALSRGASHITFMDKSTESAEANIRAFKIEPQCNVIRTDALSPPRARQVCDFVFIDPPYNKDLILPAIDALQKTGWIGTNTIIIAESEKEWSAPAPVMEKIYGMTKVSFLRTA